MIHGLQPEPQHISDSISSGLIRFFIFHSICYYSCLLSLFVTLLHYLIIILVNDLLSNYLIICSIVDKLIPLIFIIVHNIIYINIWLSMQLYSLFIYIGRPLIVFIRESMSIISGFVFCYVIALDYYLIVLLYYIIYRDTKYIS